MHQVAPMVPITMTITDTEHPMMNIEIGTITIRSIATTTRTAILIIHPVVFTIDINA